MLSRWLALLPLLLVLAACTPTLSPTRRAPAKEDTFAGQYSASGGGGALAVVKALTDRFSELHPGVLWAIDEVGSDASVKLAASGGIDLGFISRDLKSAEKSQVESLPVGAVGTAVGVNASNPIGGLTKDKIRQIFTGEISDWEAVGGAPGKIRLLIREKEAATRMSFESYFFDSNPAYSPAAIQMYDLDETLKTIHSFRDAVGMVTLDNRSLADPQVKLLAVDGAEATLSNLLTGAYKVRRPLYVINNPNPAKVKPGVKALLDFIKGSEGQDIITKVTAGG